MALLSVASDVAGPFDYAKTRGGPFDPIKHVVPANRRAEAYAYQDRVKRNLTQQELYQFGTKPAQSALKTVAKAAGSAAKVAGSVASYVPGVGTAVGAGLKVAGAAVSGENIAKAAVNAAKTSVPYVQMAEQAVKAAGDIASGRNVLKTIQARGTEAALQAVPGGDLGRSVAKAAANMAAAGVKGQNVLKAAAKETLATAIAMAPPVSRETLNAATVALANGKNPLSGAGAAAVQSALSQVADPGARAVVAAALRGGGAQTVLQNATPRVLARAASVLPGGGSQAIVQSITGKAPAELAKGQSMTTSIRPNLRALSTMNPVTVTRPTVFSRPGLRRGVHHVPLSPIAKTFVRARAGRLAADVSGLTSEGKWKVEKGDTGSSIAKALTGDPNRWTELKAVNPTLMKARQAQVAKYGFPIYVGDVINLPAGWVKPAVAPTAKPTVTPSTTTTAPTVTTPTATVVVPAQTVLAPMGDVAAQAAARATLVAWSKTDGATAAGVSDYGSATELGATMWTARDKLESASFENWSKGQGDWAGSADGEWSQALADALRLWAEKKSTQVLTPVINPTVIATNPSVQTTTPPPVVVSPGSVTVTKSPDEILGPGGIQIPQITVTPPSVQTQTTQAQAEQKPSFWQQNKSSLISGGIGLAVAALSRRV